MVIDWVAMNLMTYRSMFQTFFQLRLLCFTANTQTQQVQSEMKAFVEEYRRICLVLRDEWLWIIELATSSYALLYNDWSSSSAHQWLEVIESDSKWFEMIRITASFHCTYSFSLEIWFCLYTNYKSILLKARMWEWCEFEFVKPSLHSINSMLMMKVMLQSGYSSKWGEEKHFCKNDFLIFPRESSNFRKTENREWALLFGSWSSFSEWCGLVRKITLYACRTVLIISTNPVINFMRGPIVYVRVDLGLIIRLVLITTLTKLMTTLIFLSVNPISLLQLLQRYKIAWCNADYM